VNGIERAATGDLINLVYLISAACFITGLKLLSSAATARRGNMIGAAGMLLAVSATLLAQGIVSFRWIVVGMLVGAVIGGWLAMAVRMTAMPQMVALLNGFGGAASALIASAEFNRLIDALIRAGGPVATGVITWDVSISTMLALLIGAVTLTGSLVAFGKLQEVITGRAVVFPLQKPINALLFLGILGIAAYLVIAFAHPEIATPHGGFFIALAVLSLILGVLLVIPIGGADMPVVISLLNSYSGLAGAAAGFVLRNNVLIISGALVGASGIILTKIMCRAMNRSLTNVLFGAFGAQAGAIAAGGGGDRSVRSLTAEDAAVMMAYARSVIFVPGYGLAVAQAQHTVRELAELLEKRGVDVKYAIHPVAGRMPGHMNVLLAEADVPYTQLFEMDAINREFERADVALVIGANDVTNPAARSDPASPLYGMPILNVDHAKNIIVIKRSMASGFAGIDNPLYYDEKTGMLFGDAKKMLTALVTEVPGV
jgi:H+-translocating NAD(P) transhydrogenase subunit beta